MTIILYLNWSKKRCIIFWMQMYRTTHVYIIWIVLNHFICVYLLFIHTYMGCKWCVSIIQEVKCIWSEDSSKNVWFAPFYENLQAATPEYFLFLFCLLSFQPFGVCISYFYSFCFHGFMKFIYNYFYKFYRVKPKNK